MYLLRKERKITYKSFEIKIDFSLNKYQIQGSDFLLDCYSKQKSAFLQAVCGAGKTEIILKLIKTAISDNKVVCFCIPRVEIIKQISKRLQNYFPQLKICTLYGEKKHIDDSPLIIATPQQLINFYREFNVMIIDEVDAFPYVDNIFLKRLVNKAMIENGLLYEMSATISSDLNKKLKKKSIEYLELPVRYHLRELPVPILKKSYHFQDDLAIKEIFNLIKKSQRLIIYVSSIKKAEVLSVRLKALKLENEVISSKTKYKNEVIKKFINRDYPIIISTTILERGVTFANLSVLVLEADHSIFNSSTLVQIAGRVGRNDNFGEVVYMAKYRSEEMIKALKIIKEKNNKYAMQTM